MSGHQFQPRPIPARDEPFLDAEIDEHGANGLDADDDPDADIDDGDESLHRYGSIGRANRMAHRVINPSVLAAITGFPTDVCEEFHHALFTLLEDVGDFDGSSPRHWSASVGPNASAQRSSGGRSTRRSSSTR